MKQTREWLKHLSLAQQLSAILIVTISLFMLFVFSFLSRNIETFVNDEMLSAINRNQQSVIATFNQNQSINFSDDQTIINLIYIDGVLRYENGYDQLTDTVKSDLQFYVHTYSSTTSRTSDGRMFKLATIDNQTKIITMVSQPYENNFRSMLLDVVYLTLLGMIVLFFILIIWVGFIIHPLNLIRQYIDRIRRGEEATLVIDREDEIGELALAVIEMDAEIKKQEKLKEEMVQNISHDLKTPIATIKSYGESIKDGIYPYETLEKSVDVIIEHAERLEKKVQSLLMLNRMDYLTYINKNAGVVLMQDVVNKAILSTKQIRSEISIRVNQSDAIFMGEEEPWRVVIENLIDNALRYAVSHIEITITPTSVSVFNDGESLAEGDLLKIFNPYEKGTNGQFGLGLSIVKRVVSAYGYRVAAKNVEGGVLFEITQIVVDKRPRKKKENKE